MAEASASPAPSEQQYSLRWNDFQTSILSSFRHLRDEEDFVDVTLACEGRSFTAHKVVLSACSPYFRRLLKANPCKHPIVILRDVRGEDMESLLRFMYHGEVHIGHEQLSDFLKTAQLLQVRGLADVPAPGIAPPQPSVTTELKASPTSTSLPWEIGPGSEDRNSRERPSVSSSPRPKRARSSDLYRAQMHAAGISPERPARRDNGLDLRESLLGQALEGGPTLHLPPNQKPHSDSSLQAQSTGEDSNSSDTAMSDHGDPRDDRDRDERDERDEREERDYRDHPLLQANGGLMDSRGSSFPGALLGLQGLPGLLPGPSGMHGSADNFDKLPRGRSERDEEWDNTLVQARREPTNPALYISDVQSALKDMMRVRATDPRPCPKCGKIYRSAHTLRTHLEDKHTVCPGYRCVLCGTVAKSRNSLHSHMSRQHRGISTKDLPVLPMPSPFDPELASRLLAKAGVKISAAELRARASPTGPRRSDVKLEARSGHGSEAGGSVCGENDPEDLTMTHGHSGRYNNVELMGMSPPVSGYNHHPNTTITKVGAPRTPHSGLTPKSVDSLTKDPYGMPLVPPGATAMGSALLDTYLQFITENSFGMNMSQEHAAAAVHAAKMAQLSAMGLDKLTHSLPMDLKAQFDHKTLLEAKSNPGLDIRRDEPMDLGPEPGGLNSNQDHMDSSDDDANYSEDEVRD